MQNMLLCAIKVARVLGHVCITGIDQSRDWEVSELAEEMRRIRDRECEGMPQGLWGTTWEVDEVRFLVHETATRRARFAADHGFFLMGLFSPSFKGGGSPYLVVRWNYDGPPKVIINCPFSFLEGGNGRLGHLLTLTEALGSEWVVELQKHRRFVAEQVMRLATSDHEFETDPRRAAKLLTISKQMRLVIQGQVRRQGDLPRDKQRAANLAGYNVAREVRRTLAAIGAR